MPRPPALLPRLSVGRRGGSLLAAVVVAAALCFAQPAGSATQSGLVVVPRPSSRLGLSYFKLGTRPGQVVRAGAIELRNLSASRLRVAVAAVNGQTLSTLGSGYASPAAKPQGSTRWLHVGRRQIMLAPHHGAALPVWVRVPHNAAPGDYLSGVSVEALNQGAEGSPQKGVAIASVDRYVIGVEVSVAGPRHPLIRITGVELQREPTGLTFLLRARNFGNVILQHTFGRALITYGHLTIAELGLGPGTFVTDTAIAYPIAVLHQLPPEGSVYHVSAYLLYPGGSARVDTNARVGHAATLTPQLHQGTRQVPLAGSSGPSAKVIAAGCALIVLLLLCIGLLILRRRRTGARSTVRVLDAALQASRSSGEPVGVIAVRLPPGTAATGELLALVRSRLRQADQLCSLTSGGYLVVSADTDSETAEALAADLRRQIERADSGAGAPSGVAVEVLRADGEAGAAELLELIGESNGDAHVLTPSG
jgi:hypothetical protein